ncbi:N-terminal double-transmembrane domain-containing protein [Faunimonas pinastri]|uniref:N-terminal double-transmembrane domain-containing protein n=1 Tax=Faunimonas pinastri TaxID=1855383 RepID=A0A1H9AFJ0_9HYPH|nr:DUF4159 domain-containing protein [Faunimonas pinastri]SEP74708.1 N-terminal double-transmembrane domain-containing protein [Faunimonas pinastri]
MMGFGFLSPWILAALAALPLLWLLLRVTPPKARRVDFPPTRILLGLDDREQTPARTPWWLTALRLLLAGLIIAALAEPVLRPEARLTTGGKQPLLVLLDNGWDAAPDFQQRLDAARAAIQEAERDSRPVALVASAEPSAEGITPGAATEAERRLSALRPRPFLPDRAALAKRLAGAFGEHSASLLWIAGTLDTPGSGALHDALDRIATDAKLLQSSRPLTALLPPRNAADAIRVPLVRTVPLPPSGETMQVAGFDKEGRRILDGPVRFTDGLHGEAEIRLPAELRNEVTRFAILGEDSAGAVQLLDNRWRRKSVGLVEGTGDNDAQPLLSPLTYVRRALAPNVDILDPTGNDIGAEVDGLIGRGASILVLTDIGNLAPEVTDRLLRWIEAGGTLVRFASPRLSASDARLLPVRLREGERDFGGSLSWEQPQAIGSFPASGAFAGLAVPQDVRVERQILADPESLQGAAVWAELKDGTPLVTARRAGAGRIVLFHVTADPRWSNLPISGSFVQMLDTVVDTAGLVDMSKVNAPTKGNAPASPGAQPDTSGKAAPWKPVQVLDGFGHLTPPDPGATLVADIARTRPSAETPPGIYDQAGTIRALNTVENAAALKLLTPASLGWQGATATLQPQQNKPIWPWLLAGAAVLAVLDGLAVLLLSGRLRRPVAARAAAAVALFLLAGLFTLAPGRPALAQDNPGGAPQSALSTRLAYVRTGNSEIDDTSKAGLQGLTTVLGERTSLEPGEPAEVDIAHDELAFYSLLYWPIDPNAPVPPPETMARIDAFMQNGGTILFDTRDGGSFSPTGVSPETQKLRDILKFVNVPPLQPVPADHVLTKTFFLLQDFPGRWDTSPLWVEALAADPQQRNRPARGGDGVSPILITGNDMAAAWAVSADGTFLYPTVPADPRQREMAFRAGVNIVMYTLTGNYKADQVHVPALLERLGQ